MNDNIRDSLEVAIAQFDAAAKALEMARYELFRVGHRFDYNDPELDKLLYDTIEQRDRARGMRDYLHQYQLSKGKWT